MLSDREKRLLNLAIERPGAILLAHETPALVAGLIEQGYLKSVWPPDSKFAVWNVTDLGRAALQETDE